MGSAIYLANGVLGLVQTSTVTENLAQTEERNLGAIYVKDSDLDLVHSTVAWNTSYSEGWTKQGGDVVHLGEGLLWFERTAIVGDDCDESHGVARFTGSRNLESPGNTCGLEDDGNYVSIPEELVALGRAADNGVGETSTRTCLPASNSFLVDRIPTTRCTSRSDQRGVPRPQGDSCDIGAVERAPFDP